MAIKWWTAQSLCESATWKRWGALASLCHSLRAAQHFPSQRRFLVKILLVRLALTRQQVFLTKGDRSVGEIFQFLLCEQHRNWPLNIYEPKFRISGIYQPSCNEEIVFSSKSATPFRWAGTSSPRRYKEVQKTRFNNVGIHIDRDFICKWKANMYNTNTFEGADSELILFCLCAFTLWFPEAAALSQFITAQ